MVDPAPQESWLPPSARNDPERAEAFETLREGIPRWLRETVDQWIRKRVRRRNSYLSWDDWDVDVQRLRPLNGSAKMSVWLVADGR